MDFSKIKEWFIPQGKVKSVAINGKTVWQAKKEIEQLTTPTISLDGDILTMTATDSKTEEFVVFVDGVEKATVANEKLEEETYTVSGTWHFNDTLALPDTEIYQLVDYTFSNGYADSGFKIKPTEVILCDSSSNNATMYTKENGWESYKGETFRLITFDGTENVSQEFYEWLVENAQPQIEAGAYIFKETITYVEWSMFEFYSNGNSENPLYDEMADYGGDNRLEYVLAGSGNRTYTNVAYDYDLNTWRNEGYRTIKVPTAQTVNKESYDWFVENTLITFTIEGTQYQAERDMTWGEWVESEYNTGGYSKHVNLDAIRLNTVAIVHNNDGSCVKKNDKIINGRSYVHGAYSSGSGGSN